MPLRLLLFFAAAACHAFAARQGRRVSATAARAAKACHPGLFLLLAVVPPPSGAVLPEQTHGGATARLTVHVEDAGPQPGAALVRLTLTVTGGPLLQVERPELSDPLDAWRAERNEWCRPDGDRLTWGATIVLRQTKPGPAALPDVKVRFRDGPGAGFGRRRNGWILLKTPQDAPPPEFLPPTPPPLPWLAWAGAAAAAAAVILVGWGIARRFRRRPQPIPPEQRALRELDRLDETPPADAAAYNTALSNVVRRYLAERYGLPATQRTTAEFLETVRQNGRLADEQQAVLREFLERCDLAKFAPVGASAEECRATAGLARALVEQPIGTKSAEMA